MGVRILRYMHSTGASAFFVVVYLHMFRALIYGSYKKPRELIWIFGMLIFVVLMAEAFMGYVLPWGQMSYWGAQVIISLFGAIPVVGEALVEWFRGDYLISGITLNRFFALHVVALPIVLLALVLLHLLALHEVGSNNPDGVEIKKNKGPDGIPVDGVAFHPYYTVHDLQAIAVFLFIFCFVIFFMPEVGGLFLEAPNFEIANPLKTPEHIAPVWYFTPYYSVLRAIPDKFWGFVAFAASVAIPFLLPWLDTSKVKSMRYRPVAKQFFMGFVVACLLLGWCGASNPDDAVISMGEDKLTVAYTDAAGLEGQRTFEDYAPAAQFRDDQVASGGVAAMSVQKAPAFTFKTLSQILTAYYFAFFLLILPILGLRERPKGEPDSIHQSILGHDAPAAAPAE